MIPFRGITAMQCYVFTAFWSCGRILISWHCSLFSFMDSEGEGKPAMLKFEAVLKRSTFSPLLHIHYYHNSGTTVITEAANQTDLKNWWTLSGIFEWRLKDRSIGHRRIMSEADLLCGMQTKAKCKKEYHLVLFISWILCRHLLT